MIQKEKPKHPTILNYENKKFRALSFADAINEAQFKQCN